MEEGLSFFFKDKAPKRLPIHGPTPMHLKQVVSRLSRFTTKEHMKFERKIRTEKGEGIGID